MFLYYNYFAYLFKWARQGDSDVELFYNDYNIEAFGDLDEFMSDVDQYLAKIKDSKPAPGFEEVLYAGLPESNEEKERSANGIPYHPEVVEWFRSITSELGVDFNF